MALAMMNEDRAAQYLREVLESSPNDPRVLTLAYLRRGQLGLSGDELLSRLRESSPDNALPNIIVASKYFNDNDREKGEKALLSAYDQEGISTDFAQELLERKHSLLTEAGRTPAQASVRALAVQSYLGDFRNIFAQVDDIIGDSEFAEDSQRIGALLLDLSHDAQEQTQLWQRAFALHQEKKILDKFAGIEQKALTVEFSDSLDVLLSGVEADIHAVSQHINQSKAIVPIMQQLANIPGGIEPFADMYYNSGELAALEWLRLHHPSIAQDFDGRKLGIRPSPSFWD